MQDDGQQRQAVSAWASVAAQCRAMGLRVGDTIEGTESGSDWSKAIDPGAVDVKEVKPGDKGVPEAGKDSIFEQLQRAQQQRQQSAPTTSATPATQAPAATPAPAEAPKSEAPKAEAPTPAPTAAEAPAPAAPSAVRPCAADFHRLHFRQDRKSVV